MFKKRGVDKVACEECNAELKYATGSTSAMKRHAEKLHAQKWKEINAEADAKTTKQPKVSAFFGAKPKPIEKYALKSAKRKALNRKLVAFICKDQRPPSMVRDEGFRDFCNEMDPRYILPTIGTIQKKLLPNLYDETMIKVQSQLDSVKNITLTTDGWTSVATDKYNSFTAHFIDWSSEEPALISKILECAPYEKSSTIIELEKELRRVTEKYNITSKIKLTIADNAGDIQGALNLFGAPSVGCVAHTLNLVAKHAMKNFILIENLTKKLANLVRTTKVSPGAKRALAECCKIVGIQGKTILISFVKTRWNSVYMMFQRALDLKSALILYFAQYNIDESDALNSEDWNLIADFTEILRHLYTVTIELCAEKHSTLSKVIPMVNILFHHYRPQNEESETAKEFRAMIYDQLKYYFHAKTDVETEATYSISTILDPRFKDLVFSTKAKSLQAVKFAKTDAVEVAHENNENPDDEEEPEETTSTASKSDDFWDVFDSQKELFDSKTVKVTKKSKKSDYYKSCVDLEMRQYLSVPRLDRKSCPIQYWKNVGSKQFPLLFECAKKYLCMLATSVPSERVFSNAGQILTKRRNRLNKDTANILITLHTNLKN